MVTMVPVDSPVPWASPAPPAPIKTNHGIALMRSSMQVVPAANVSAAELMPAAVMAVGRAVRKSKDRKAQDNLAKLAPVGAMEALAPGASSRQTICVALYRVEGPATPNPVKMEPTVQIVWADRVLAKGIKAWETLVLIGKACSVLPVSPEDPAVAVAVAVRLPVLTHQAGPIASMSVPAAVAAAVAVARVSAARVACPVAVPLVST